MSSQPENEQTALENVTAAGDIFSLVGLYQSQGKYSEAEPLYLRAIQILEKALGSEHPNTVTVRQNYEIMCETTKET